MTLSEIRQQLITLSGRYDLVVDAVDYVDNGANFFINAAQRWLDRKLDDKYTIKRVFKSVQLGAIGVTFDWCRTILQVWVQDAVEGTRTLLEKKSSTWLKEEYNNLSDALDTGTPLYYTPAFLNAYPQALTMDDFKTYLGFADFAPMSPDDVVYDGVIFMPPASQEFMVEVLGHFYSTNLTVDTQSSYWTVRHPELLLMSAMRMMEVFKRNSEGVKDWEASIGTELMDLDKDAADEDATDFDEMEG